MKKFIVTLALLVATWQVQMAVEAGVSTVSTRHRRRMLQPRPTQAVSPCPPGAKSCPNMPPQPVQQLTKPTR
jgi:hypothetical protein